MHRETKRSEIKGSNHILLGWNSATKNDRGSIAIHPFDWIGVCFEDVNNKNRLINLEEQMG